MEFLDILLISWIVILIGIIIFILVHSTKRFHRLQNDYSDYKKLKYNEIYQKEKNNLDIDLAQLSKEIQRKRKELDEIEIYNTKVKCIQDVELAERIKTKETAALAQLDNDIKEWAKSAQEAENTKYLQLKDYYYNLTDELYDTYNKILTQVNEIQAQRNALNEEILRAREMKEQQDFYRIQLEDSAKSDIRIINSVRDKLVHIELFNKLIFNNYIERPTKEMIKRVLGGTDTSGIYKVTNIQTKEIYIGKSTNISNRWLGHVKSACGLEGVADSQFQRALKKYGVDSFTWEILEKVPKEKLTEREKYFINFYDTKKYGYNQREG